MSSEIVFVKSYNKELGVVDFLREVNQHPVVGRNFLCARMSPENIKDILRDYITENGISSLFHFDVVCDAVLHPGIHVDDIEKLLLGFVKKLRGVKNLLIIDPYLYADGAQSVGLFNRMMTTISDTFEEVAILTNGRKVANKAAMHGALKALAPSVRITDRDTDEFHDRCWIDRDRGIGFYMGTSLNGVGKKMCLVDHMRDSDARAVCSLANGLL